MSNNAPAAGGKVRLSSVHLDAVRGFAALLVVMGHTRILFLNSLTRVAQSHSAGGHAGYTAMVSDDLAANGNSMGHEAVMIFFVLSGYLVGGSVLKLMQRNAWSWRDYLLRRLTRLWVVLIPALLLGMALDHLGMRLFANSQSIYAGPSGQTLVMTNLASRYSPGIILGNLAFLQNICFPTAGTNVALWSLSNEFWYYMAFPVLLLGLQPRNPLWKRFFCLAGFLGIMLGIGGHSARLFLVWVLGAVLSAVPLKLPEAFARRALIALTLGLAAGMVWVKAHVNNLAVAEFTISLVFAGLLYTLLHQTGTARAGLYRSISALSARMSYTLYLVHVPILVFLCAWVNHPWRILPRTPANIALALGTGGITLGIAFLLYLIFEAHTEMVRNFIAARLPQRSS